MWLNPIFKTCTLPFVFDKAFTSNIKVKIAFKENKYIWTIFELFCDLFTSVYKAT